MAVEGLLLVGLLLVGACVGLVTASLLHASAHADAQSRREWKDEQRHD